MTHLSFFVSNTKVWRDRQFLTKIPVNRNPVYRKKITPAKAFHGYIKQNIKDHVDIPGHIRVDYALECKGDSMINAWIRNGDIVYIRVFTGEDINRVRVIGLAVAHTHVLE